MSSIVGFVNLKHNLQNKKEILTQMMKKLIQNTPSKENFYLDNEISLGNSDTQPIRIKHNDNIYTITFNGRLYNASEMRNVLLEKGFTFMGTSDAEVVLNAFIEGRI